MAFNQDELESSFTVGFKLDDSDLRNQLQVIRNAISQTFATPTIVGSGVSRGVTPTGGQPVATAEGHVPAFGTTDMGGAGGGGMSIQAETVNIQAEGITQQMQQMTDGGGGGINIRHAYIAPERTLWGSVPNFETGTIQDFIRWAREHIVSPQGTIGIMGEDLRQGGLQIVRLVEEQMRMYPQITPQTTMQQYQDIALNIGAASGASKVTSRVATASRGLLYSITKGMTGELGVVGMRTKLQQALNYATGMYVGPYGPQGQRMSAEHGALQNLMTYFIEDIMGKTAAQEVITIDPKMGIIDVLMSYTTDENVKAFVPIEIDTSARPVGEKISKVANYMDAMLDKFFRTLEGVKRMPTSPTEYKAVLFSHGGITGTAKDILERRWYQMLLGAAETYDVPIPDWIKNINNVFVSLDLNAIFDDDLIAGLKNVPEDQALQILEAIILKQMLSPDTIEFISKILPSEALLRPDVQQRLFQRAGVPNMRFTPEVQEYLRSSTGRPTAFNPYFLVPQTDTVDQMNELFWKALRRGGGVSGINLDKMGAFESSAGNMLQGLREKMAGDPYARHISMQSMEQFKQYFGQAPNIRLPYESLRKSFMFAATSEITSLLGMFREVSPEVTSGTIRMEAWFTELKKIHHSQNIPDNVKFGMLKTLLDLGNVIFTDENARNWFFTDLTVEAARKELPEIRHRLMARGGRQLDPLMSAYEGITMKLMDQPNEEDRRLAGGIEDMDQTFRDQIKYLGEMKMLGEAWVGGSEVSNADRAALGWGSTIDWSDPLRFIKNVGARFLGRMPSYFTRHQLTEKPVDVSQKTYLINFLFPFVANGQINTTSGKGLISNLTRALGSEVVIESMEYIQRSLHAPLMNNVSSIFIYDNLEKVYDSWWKQQGGEFRKDFVDRRKAVTDSLRFFSDQDLTNKAITIIQQRVSDGVTDPDSPMSRAKAALEGLGSLGAIMSLGAEFQSFLDMGTPNDEIPKDHLLSILGKTKSDAITTLSVINQIAKDFITSEEEHRVVDPYDVFSNYNWLKDNMLKIVLPTDITVWDLSVGN